MLLFVVTTTMLASANMFGQSYLITQGAPGDADPDRGLVHRRRGAAGLRRRPGRRHEHRCFALMLAVVSIVNFRLFRYRED